MALGGRNVSVIKFLDNVDFLEPSVALHLLKNVFKNRPVHGLSHFIKKVGLMLVGAECLASFHVSCPKTMMLITLLRGTTFMP